MDANARIARELRRIAMDIAAMAGRTAEDDGVMEIDMDGIRRLAAEAAANYIEAGGLKFIQYSASEGRPYYIGTFDALGSDDSHQLEFAVSMADPSPRTNTVSYRLSLKFWDADIASVVVDLKFKKKNPSDPDAVIADGTKTWKVIDPNTLPREKVLRQIKSKVDAWATSKEMQERLANAIADKLRTKPNAFQFKYNFNE